MNTINIKCTSSDIPALSLAVIDSYDETNQCFLVSQPSGEEDANKVIAVQKPVSQDKIGEGVVEGVTVIKKDSTVSVSAGDKVGIAGGQWTATKDNDNYFVLNVSGDVLVVRKLGGGGSSPIHYAYTKTDAPASNTITCYLDTNPDDATEDDEITVYCEICGAGSYLNDASPQLKAGTRLFVMKAPVDKGTYWEMEWCCITPFQSYILCDCYDSSA